MEKIELKAKEKTVFNKRYNKRLRKRNGIPAVIYDAKGNNKHIIIDHSDFLHVFKKARSHAIISIDCNGKKEDVIVRDYQIEPLYKGYSHIDFYRVLPNTELKARIPVHFEGSPEGVKVGGVIEHFLYDIKVICKPENLIHIINVDIEHLEIRDGIFIRDLSLGENIKILNPQDQCIVRVVQSRKAKVDEEEVTDELGEEGEEGEEKVEDAAEKDKKESK
jgi:large subunit ribosomal protein L25